MCVLCILVLKTIVRSPSWWIFVVTSVGLAWLLNSAGLNSSLGDLGRQVMAITQIIGFLFAAIFGTYVIFLEFKHSDVVRSTPVTEVKLLIFKLVAAGVAGLLAVLSGTIVSFLINGILTRRLSMSGIEWSLIYLCWSLTIFFFWNAFAMFLSHLRCPRWLSIGISMVTAIGVPTLVFSAGIPEKLAIPLRFLFGFIEADFPTPFSPLGMFTAEVFLLRIAWVAGGALTLLGTTLLMVNFSPDSAKKKMSFCIAIVAIGMVLLGGGSSRAWFAITAKIAPFSAQELWEGRASLDWPYTVEKTGQLLVTPKPYMAFVLPSTHTLPHWIHKLSSQNRVEVFELDLWSPYYVTKSLAERVYALAVPARLVLVYPINVDYPKELSGVVAWFKAKLHPMLQLAQLWVEKVEALRIVVIPHGDPSLRGRIYSFSNGLIVPYSVILKWTTEELWGVAWALAKMANLGPEEQAFVAICLVRTIAPSEAEHGLNFYKGWAEKGIPPYTVPNYLRATRRIYKPQKVLEHWRRGEELGHENYIRMLLEGAKR